MLAKLSSRDRKALVAAGTGVALFLVTQFVVFPLLDRKASGGGSVEDKEITLRRSQRLVVRAATERENLSLAEGRLKTLEAGLLESPSTSLANAEWQRLVREMADSKGVELGSSEFLRLQPLSPDYALVAGRVQFRSRLDQLVDFLVALATSPKLFSVRRVRIYASQGDPQKRLNVELTLGAALRAAASEGLGSSQR